MGFVFFFLLGLGLGFYLVNWEIDLDFGSTGKAFYDYDDDDLVMPISILMCVDQS